ncbi:alcohol dehydrogenase zinc-binding domain-containing protein [Exidia glandulosa HHB12029]|uniref:Alcohol dehydrogenase zinc-binding domain-containing protein n=1 Tax=Exidia glandulosa HHB12029 TaxID=1314781 RepID=A0A165P9I7_EXIGL|nr:alcohol dehydrogenase zinc-binding domain-containing protein [Exidia glandulosa HHB12029]
MSYTKTMRQWYWPGKVAGYRNLVIREVPIPAPGPGEVLVKIHAISLNYRDIVIANDQYAGRKIIDDLTPGADPAGEVAGGDVDDWGQTASLVNIPDHLTYEEASTLSCAGVTAYRALLDGPAPIKAGETIVLQGTGGVSIFAAQIAVAAGVRVILTSSSDKKLEFAKSLGVHEVINYRSTPAWHERVLSLTNGRGAELVLDVAGGDTVTKSLDAIKFGGQVVLVGFLEGGISPGDLVIKAMFRNALVRGITVVDITLFKQLLRLVEFHKIKPVVGKVFQFEEAKDAFACLEKQDFVGKVVIRISKD